MAAAGKQRRVIDADSIPDVGGKGQAVELLAQLLATAQAERRKIEMTRVANGHELTDPIPYRPSHQYGEALDEITQQERRLCDAYPDELEVLRKQVSERDGSGA